ncbi:MAG: hypothetical protein IT258_00385 [Saprospiraceae bacterium]|nr:hypothetical protein [Saprospiraceae bacterium]
MNDKELRDELGELPFLKKMKEQSPQTGLQVPKNYFKHLPDEVLRKAKEPVPQPLPQPSWMERAGEFFAGLLQPRYAMAFASVLALVVAGIWFIGKSDRETAPPIAAVSLNDISDEELFAYVSENISDFDHDLVLETAGPELPEIKTQSKTKPSLPKTAAPKPEVEEMEEYIDDVIDEINVEDLEELL